jgi:hypothetical protein
MSLEGIVHSSETATLLTEAAAQSAASGGQAQGLAAASADTRREVQTLERDVFDRRIFDPYLRFSSPEDEAEFRKREAEARKYIDEQLARGTPEGNLNASGGMIGTLLDAHTHGAGNSPDFMPRWDALVEKARRQRASMHAAGQSTEEFDRHVAASVHRFLEAKGLSDTEIDRRLKASADPLDVVKPFLSDDRDSQDLERKIQGSAHIEQAATASPISHVETSDATAVADAPLTINLDAMNAKLKAVGLQMSDNTDAADHGLTVAKPAGKTGPGITG